MNARLKRRLRVVEGCPMPDPPPYRPIEYGAAPWSRLPPTPTADQITIRVRAQSLLTKQGKPAELPSYEEAVRILAENEHT